MYCSHFKLKRKPFQLSSDNSFLWLGNSHARALGLLKRGIDGPQRLMVLTGDIGTGKTTLIHELRHSLAPGTALAHITDPSMELHYLLLSIAQGFGFEALYHQGEKFAPILAAFLSQKHRKGERCLIILDEVHLIPERFLAQLLSWSRSAPANTLTILLAGQLEFHGVIEKALGITWQSRVDVHAQLAPLDEKETRQYINRRLELAGATHSIFLPATIRQAHQFAKGIPRRINIACDQAMIAAFAEEKETVDPQMFQEAVGIIKLPAAIQATPPPLPVVRAPRAVQPIPIYAAPPRRRPVKAVAGLAAGLALATLGFIYSHRTGQPPVPPINETVTAQASMASGTLSKPAEPPIHPPELKASPAPYPLKAPDMSVPPMVAQITPVIPAPAPLPAPLAPEMTQPDAETGVEAYEPPDPIETTPEPIQNSGPEKVAASPENESAPPPGTSDMDEFIKEVFMIKPPPVAAVSVTEPPPRQPVSPRPLGTEPTPVATAPHPEPNPNTEPEPVPAKASASAPAHGDIIDWLINKKR